MTRWRVALTVVFALLLVGVVASWCRSRMAMDMASYCVGMLRAPGEDANDPTMWTYRSTLLSVNHRHGLIGFVCTRNRSVALAKEELQPWMEAPGLHSFSVPISMVRQAGKWKWARYESPTNWNLLSLGMTTSSHQGQENWTMDVPHWMPALVLAAVMMKLAVVPWWRWRRGRCPRCAYDLRGVVGDRCPECGDLSSFFKPKA